MTLRLDPGIPTVWRSPWELQFGVERVLVRLGDLTAERERMISALTSGVSLGGLELLARGRGEAARREVGELLDLLDPVLEEPRTEQGGGGIAVVGRGRLASAISSALGHDPAPRLTVLVTAWVVSPADAGAWLRRDAPHLPVVESDGVVTIGPLVRPGIAPCLWCVHRARSDADPAWPAIATQLLDRPAPALGAVAHAETVALVGRVAHAAIGGPGRRLAPGTSLTVDVVTGDITQTQWTPHADCRCAAPTGSGWPFDADLAVPVPTSSTTGSSAPA